MAKEIKNVQDYIAQKLRDAGMTPKKSERPERSEKEDKDNK